MDSAARYAINGDEVTSSDPRFQDLLAAAYNVGTNPRCPCVSGGVEMYIAKYREFVVKRMPGTGEQHHPTCPSYEPPTGQSGLGEVLGEAIIERTAELTEVRLDFPLARRLGRSVTAGEPGEKTEVAALRRRLGLRGLLHLLWERAGFNRWYPRMAGKRSWWVVRKHLLDAAREIETKGLRLADRLLIPEPFRLEEASEIAQRRAQSMAILLSPSEDVEFKMMVAIGELKEFAPTEIDYRILLMHMPDSPLYMEKRAGDKFKKVFSYEYETWVHQKSGEREKREGAGPPELRFIFAGLIYARRENVFAVDTATIIMTTAYWVPVDYTYERTLADELVRQGRGYLKPLRYESRRGASFPNFILLDTGDRPTALDIISPFMPDKERGTKELALKGRQPPGWVWRIDEGAAFPVLPAVTRRH